jgi:hypothetical protein
MDNFKYTPEEGFLDEGSYPNPSSGTQSRTQLMSLHAQVRDFINNTIVAGINSLIETVSGKQDALTFDNAPTADSANPVKSGGVYTALSGKQDSLTFDNVPTSGSNNPVKSGGVYTALGDKQDTLTFDNAPTSGSNNPVKSGGVYTAVNDLHTSFTTNELKLVSNGTTYVISVDSGGNVIATPEA